MRQPHSYACRLPFISAVAVLLLGCSGRVPAPGERPATGSIEGESSPSSHSSVSAAPWQDAAQRLTAALVEHGYIVQEGQMRFFQLEDCLAFEACHGNNPSSPYGMYCLPPPPGDMAARPVKPPCPPESNLRWSWRLRPDEALIFLGRTPPPAAYFSFRSYLFSRQGLFRRRQLFASLGDTLNLQVIATTGTPNGARGNAFGQDTVVITTADRHLDAWLRQLLVSSGAPEAVINTDIVPHALARMGVQERSDEFTMLFRVALFADSAAGERYMKAPPATILRVTPPMPLAIDPFPVPPLRPRGTHTSEVWLRPALDELIAAVKARYRGFAVRNRRILTVNPSGRTCIRRGRPCFGDNPDTVYHTSLPTWLSDHPGDFLIVVGVQHEATGKARYMNLGVYHTARFMGIDAVAGSEVTGSADLYLPQLPWRKYLYAYKFARDCQGEPFCFAVPTGGLGVPLDGALNFIERPYLEPVTSTGPLPSQLIAPEVLHFCPSFTVLGKCDP